MPTIDSAFVAGLIEALNRAIDYHVGVEREACASIIDAAKDGDESGALAARIRARGQIVADAGA